MTRWTLASLPVLAAVLGACATIEPQSISPQASESHPVSPQASPLPEPPPGNSIEMMWMDTEIVQAPFASPLSI